MLLRLKHHYDLIIHQGEDYEKDFQWCYAGGRTPVNLAGFTGKCQIKSDAQSNIILATPLVSIIDATNGVFRISLSHTLSTEITTDGSTYNSMNYYVYDVELTSPTGKVYRVLQGYAKVSPEVTK